MIDERVAIFFGQIDAFNPFSLKTGLRFVKAEIDKMLFVYRLFEGVEICRCLVRAIENTKRIAIYEIRRRCREANHSRIEIVDDLGEALENRTVRFIKNDEVVRKKKTAFASLLFGRRAEQHKEQGVIEHNHVGREQSLARERR